MWSPARLENVSWSDKQGRLSASASCAGRPHSVRNRRVGAEPICHKGKKAAMARGLELNVDPQFIRGVALGACGV